jgi:chromosome segregation ATPase
MPKADSIIETGVDRLVDIINRKKKISVGDAAKELGVSTSVIEEWANFLEEEGLITLDYKLATTYLCEKKLTKKEINKKEKEYSNSKDVFTRNVEITSSQIDKETKGFERLKNQFGELKEVIGEDFISVKEKLSELENYEKLKKSIDHEMVQQQADIKKKFAEIEKEYNTEKDRFKELLNDSKLEAIKLEEEKSQLVMFKDEESQLLAKLKDITNQVGIIKEQIGQEEKMVGVTEDHLGFLQKNIKRVEQEMQESAAKVDELKKQSKAKEEQIISLQKEVLGKVLEKRKEIMDNVHDSEEVFAKFNDFFNRRSQIEKLINKIESDKKYLKDELQNLKSKAVAFNLASKNTDVKKHIIGLEKKFKNLDSKRNLFKDELKKLSLLIINDKKK